MVKVEKLIMQGFKSFASRVEIPFSNGFICVAGPNGSGKSNIIDAITFVLGVTSAKAIRAQKLERLIFNGARNKKPAEFCEVTLVLDNNDHKIPGEDDVVNIVRRVNRSGVSIYKINNKTVNKAKIIDTLAHANLSPDGYNIIMQGDVTRIIEMSPKQRREIIDDISGITEFNEKKEDTLRKLEKVETRVRESMIVIVEKQKRIEQLKKEKEAAEKYISLNDELRKTTASIIKFDIDQDEKTLQELKIASHDSKKEFDDVDKELKKFEKDLDKKELTSKKKSDEIIETRSFDTIREIEKTTTEILRKRDKIDALERELSYMKKDDRDFSHKLPIKANKFSSIIRIREGYSTAIEVATGNHAHDLIVDTDDDASACIKVLKERRLGRARFLPLNKIRGHVSDKTFNFDGFLGLAIHFVEYDRKYSPAVEYVLGTTLVFDTLDNARRLRGQRIVTLDGELIEKSGAIIGGHRERKSTFDSSHILKEKEFLINEIDALEDHRDILRAKEEEEKKKFVETKQEKTELDQELEDIKKSIKEFVQKKFVINNKMNKDKIEQARIETSLEDLKRKIKEYKDVQEFLDLPRDELQRNISYAVGEIRRIGPVNVKAIEEYQSIAVEFEEMKKKLDGLIGEKNSIVTTIADIETRRKEKFSTVMNEIAKYFSQIYYDMVGGTGTVRLEDPNNIDSGLVIESSPAGKRVVDLDLMSGGEKTMASLGFLFAILQHYASPFYVLDEVDAALDKVNKKRVADLVKKYSKKTQFIVISHDDVTISAADKVFGIANQDGVSKVFGLELPKR